MITWREINHDLTFRSIVLATLIITASLFATRMEPGKQEHSHSERVQSEVTQDEKLLGFKSDWWNAFSAAATACFTLVLVITSYFQIRAVQESNAATRVAADAARRSTDAMLALERGFVGFSISNHNLQKTLTSISTYPNSPDMHGYNGTLDVLFSARNFGKNVILVQEISAIVCVGRNRPTHKSQTLNMAFSRAALASGEDTGTLQLRMPVRTTRQQANDLLRKTISIWVMLRIEYRDVLGDAVEYEDVYEFDVARTALSRSQQRTFRNENCY